MAFEVTFARICFLALPFRFPGALPTLPGSFHLLKLAFIVYHLLVLTIRCHVAIRGRRHISRESPLQSDTELLAGRALVWFHDL